MEGFKKYGILKFFVNFIFFLFATVVFYVTNGEPLVPAFFIFGDSIVDVGNNNLHIVVKANFFPN